MPPASIDGFGGINVKELDMNHLRDVYQSMWGLVEYASTVGTFDSISPRFWKLSDMANRELDFLGEKVNENIPIRLNQIRGYIDEYDNRVIQDAQNKHIAWMDTYRPNGWYLMRGLTLEYLYDNGTQAWDDSREDCYEIDTDDVVNDSVINLEQLKYLLENGGLENAVEVVKKDSSKTSSVLFLEKELKRYKDWYGDMDSLSR